jgi:hypothetical protein
MMVRCNRCRQPAQFIYMTFSSGNRVPLCASCVYRAIQNAVRECRLRDPALVPAPLDRVYLN